MINVNLSLDVLNTVNKGTLMESLGIEFTEFGTDYLIAKMPVDERTFQPMRLLHGGANVALAESLGSAGTYLMLDKKTHYGVCIEINANHVGSASEGYVFGKAMLIHKGKTTHVWNVEIRDEKKRLICSSRLTMMIIKHKE